MTPRLPALITAGILLSACAANAAVSKAAKSPREGAYKAALPLYKYDRKAPLNVQVIPGKRYTDSQELHILYSSANGERVPAVIFEPGRASYWHPAPAIILLHGLGGSKETLVPFGHFLAATGYAVLIIDEYGQGDRRKTVSPDRSAAADQADAIHGIQQTVIDVRRGIDYLHTRLHVNPKRISVVGFSLGAIIGADVMGIDSRIKCGALISGGGDLGLILRNLSANDPKFKTSRYGRLQPAEIQMLGAMLAAEDPLTFAGHIAPRPILMQNGKLDKIIPPEAAKALFNSLSKTPGSHATMQWFPDSGHFIGLNLMYPKLREWLKKNL